MIYGVIGVLIVLAFSSGALLMAFDKEPIEEEVKEENWIYLDGHYEEA